MELERKAAKAGQWVLVLLSLIMFLMVLGMASRLFMLEKQSSDSSSNTETGNTSFLGMSVEPRQAARGQWMLLVLCLILMLCSIILTIRIFSWQNQKPPWMKPERGSSD